MNLKKNRTYQINFISSKEDPSELDYQGPGTFTGEVTINESDNVELFLFKDLSTKKGFSSEGWFSVCDIEKEL